MNKQGYTKNKYLKLLKFTAVKWNMDQQTTSQCVGREFVKQYYTVLHETPLDMYRFYTDKSSYLHGGDEQAGHELSPVCGQTVIKIHNI